VFLHESGENIRTGKPRFIFIIAIATIFLVMLLSTTTLADRDLNDLIRKTKNELSRKKRKENSVLKNLVYSQRKLDKSKKNLQHINSKLLGAEKKMRALSSELNDLQRDMEMLHKEQERRRNLAGRRLAALYKYGIFSYLQVFFQAEDFADFASRFGMVMYFVNNDRLNIVELDRARRAIKNQQEKIEQAKFELEQEQAKYVSLQEKYAKQQQNISIQVAKTQSELSGIQSERKRLETALDEYEQTSREIEAQIRKSQRGDDVQLGTGRMIWPVKGRISSPFGYRYHPVLQKKKFHNGIDIAASTGTPVLAADSGVVLVSGWRGGYGYYIAIDHGKGRSTAYGHNSRLLVKEGEAVVRGQTIAHVGSTGLSTGPHVHFEVRVNGQPTNPRNYLP
jgi:murein DD-endopeptidase MepM/ murein hydrolase activator NlpD